MFTRLKSLLSTKALHPADESSAHKAQGDEHLKQGQLDDAAACYRRAVQGYPSDVDAWVGLGFALSELRQFREAEQYVRHALSLDPANADAHYILGTISKNQNDPLGSIDHFARALALKEDFEFAYRDLFAALFQSGQLEKAKEIVGKAIAVRPRSAEFHFYLGNLLSHEENHDQAIASYRKALSIQPGSAETHKRLADALRTRGQFDQAIAGYQKALSLEPDLLDAHVDLGGVMLSQGKADLAIAHYERAVLLKPDCTAAQIGLGNALQSRGRIDEAIACYRRAVALEPQMAATHQHLGNALVEKGSTHEAVACYEQVVRLDPKNAVKHLVAALSEGGSERAPSDYVEHLFDGYAHKFDSHLVEVLSYTVPEKLAELLRPHADSEGDEWAVLDLGCGSGLSGAAIAPFARHIVGVDLSAKMLDKARERNLYHRLEHLDLLTMMRGEVPSGYDVVLAADVFVYLGKLDELVTEVQRLLRPGGLFAFSVESLEALADGAAAPSDGRDYQLNVTGRYAHSTAYLARMAAHGGFEVLGTTGTQSRLDKGQPVQGYLVLWRRRAA